VKEAQLGAGLEQLKLEHQRRIDDLRTREHVRRTNDRKDIIDERKSFHDHNRRLISAKIYELEKAMNAAAPTIAMVAPSTPNQ
jgi:hypothetical protein